MPIKGANARWESDPELAEFRDFLRGAGAEIERTRKLRRSEHGQRAIKNSGAAGKYTLEWMDSDPNRIDIKYFQGLITGRKNFTLLTLYKICRKLSVQPAEILGNIPLDSAADKAMKLRVLRESEVRPYQNAIPVFDITAAAGRFSMPQLAASESWIAFDKPARDLFACQVVGDSMDKVIPDGSWCLFRANPEGSRQNKIVLVQYRDSTDSDQTGRYTIKRYASEKREAADGTMEHTRIILRPESYNPSHQPIVLTPDQAESLWLVAEFLRVL
jgi:SOS-response transcriptional repressor LexA